MIYFPEPFDCTINKIRVESNLAYYATKSDLKNAASVDTSKCPIKSDLTNLKLDVDELHISKVKSVPVDLSKLSNVVNEGIRLFAASNKSLLPR